MKITISSAHDSADRDTQKSSLSLKSILIRALFALLAAAVISSLKLDFIESYLYDVRVTLKAFLGLSEPKRSPIALVKIDNQTIEKYQSFPGYKLHTDFSIVWLSILTKAMGLRLGSDRPKKAFKVTRTSYK